MIERTPRQDDDLGGYRIPAGSLVVVSPFVLHRHPELWNRSLKFDPSRFTLDRSEERHRFAYLPFPPAADDFTQWAGPGGGIPGEVMARVESAERDDPKLRRGWTCELGDSPFDLEP